MFQKLSYKEIHPMWHYEVNMRAALMANLET